jgi:hypothetical protein
MLSPPRLGDSRLPRCYHKLSRYPKNLRKYGHHVAESANSPMERVHRVATLRVPFGFNFRRGFRIRTVRIG